MISSKNFFLAIIFSAFLLSGCSVNKLYISGRAEVVNKTGNKINIKLTRLAAFKDHDIKQTNLTKNLLKRFFHTKKVMLWAFKGNDEILRTVKILNFDEEKNIITIEANNNSGVFIRGANLFFAAIDGSDEKLNYAISSTDFAIKITSKDLFTLRLKNQKNLKIFKVNQNDVNAPEGATQLTSKEFVQETNVTDPKNKEKISFAAGKPTTQLFIDSIDNTVKDITLISNVEIIKIETISNDVLITFKMQNPDKDRKSLNDVITMSKKHNLILRGFIDSLKREMGDKTITQTTRTK